MQDLQKNSRKLRKFYLETAMDLEYPNSYASNCNPGHEAAAAACSEGGKQEGDATQAHRAADTTISNLGTSISHETTASACCKGGKRVD